MWFGIRYWCFGGCSLHLESTLEVEEAHSSETYMPAYQTTWNRIQEDHNFKHSTS